MADKCIIPYMYTFADKRMGLYSGILPNTSIFLNFDKRPNKTFLSNFTAVQINKLFVRDHYRFVTTFNRHCGGEKQTLLWVLTIGTRNTHALCKYFNSFISTHENVTLNFKAYYNIYNNNPSDEGAVPSSRVRHHHPEEEGEMRRWMCHQIRLTDIIIHHIISLFIRVVLF